MSAVIMVFKRKFGQQSTISKSGILSVKIKKQTSKAKAQVDKGGCTHCGNVKGTRGIYFKLHGYPEWWNELKAQKQSEAP